MKKSKLNHKYLFHLYARVDTYLSSDHDGANSLPDVVVSFCVVVEKILKIKLHRKNPVLVFDNSRIKETDALLAVVLRKDRDIETSKIGSILERFKIMFKDIFSDDELQALLDIYDVRNCFVHGYRADNKIVFNDEDIIKKMGTIWEKISIQVVVIFGKESIKSAKPKKKYSELELEQALINEVKTKINMEKGSFGYHTLATSVLFPYHTASALNYPSEAVECPRCGVYGFSVGDDRASLMPFIRMSTFNANDVSSYSGSGLYKCGNCHLELTKKEYEIAKKIKTSENDTKATTT